MAYWHNHMNDEAVVRVAVNFVSVANCATSDLIQCYSEILLSKCCVLKVLNFCSSHL